MRITESKAEKAGGIIILLFSLGLLLLVIPSQVKNVQGFGVSSRLFPSILAVILALLALCLLVSSLRKKSAQKLQSSYEISAKETKLVLITIVIIASYILTVKLLGYLVTTIIALGLLMYFYGQKKIKTIVITSLIVPLVIHQFFTKLMQIRLP